MNYWWRRIVLSLVAVLVLVLVYAGLYQLGMAAFEGETKTYAQSIQAVIESLTTAGFGGDAPWESTAMNLFVVAMNLTGVLLVFLALPLIVVPLFQQALEDRPPESTDLLNHVVICSYTPRSDVLAGNSRRRTSPTSSSMTIPNSSSSSTVRESTPSMASSIRRRRCRRRTPSRPAPSLPTSTRRPTRW